MYNHNINMNNNIMKYYDLIYDLKNVKSPNLDKINKLFKAPSGYPVENNISNHIRDKFLKIKRYNDDFLMPGYEVYLNNGELIDASFITSNILAGSAPTVQALNNFWSMIWEKNVRIIVSLTSWIENDRVKADLYFNPSINEMITFGNISVHTIADVTNIFSKMTHIDLMSKNIKVLQFKIINYTTNTARYVYHLHYTGWFDMGVPSIRDMYALLKVFSHQKSNIEHNDINNPKTFIHCSAGIGRTGTFLVLFEAINRINIDIKNNNFNSSINLQDIILVYRMKRRGLVQTQQQIDFIINFLSTYLTKIVKEHNHNIMINQHM